MIAIMAEPPHIHVQKLTDCTLSISVTKSQQGCTITLISNIITWTVRVSFRELSDLHHELSLIPTVRGILLPSLPDAASSTSSAYQQYLTHILCRTCWINLNQVLIFIQAPAQFRNAIKTTIRHEKKHPIKYGVLKKEGEKNKAYSKRYFVLRSNLLLEYWDTQQSYVESVTAKAGDTQIKKPKGHIDLLLVDSIITENLNKKYSFHLSTPNRIWKLQCKSEQEKNEWIKVLHECLTSRHSLAFMSPHITNSPAPTSPTSPKSPKSPKKTNEEVKDLFLSRNSKPCVDAETCESILRIAYILSYHYTLMKVLDSQQPQAVHDMDDEKADIEQTKPAQRNALHDLINNELYPYNNIRLNNDFFHLITHHRQHEYVILYEKVMDEMDVPCEIATCSSFERLEKAAIQNGAVTDDGSGRGGAAGSRYHLQQSQKEQDIFHVVDTIHCYFLHAFDVGMRLSEQQLFQIQLHSLHHREQQKEQEQKRSVDDFDEEDDEDDEKQTGDVHFSVMKKLLIAQKQQLLKQLNFVQKHYNDAMKNKFITPYRGNNETDEITHTFGVKFFYWTWYKTNDELDMQYNIGYKISDFYVERRFQDIKTEILYATDSQTFCVDEKRWDYLLRRALALLRCDMVKRMKCNHMASLQHYDSNLELGSVITVTHILSVLIYTTYHVLQRDLTSTYRRLTDDESIESLKSRHGKYANWARYLFETVQCFGHELEPNQVLKEQKKGFYHGIDSMLYVTNSIINFHYPVSATSSIVVATGAMSACNMLKQEQSKDGLMLKLTKSEDLDERATIFKLTCFNCAIFSDFAYEDEFLFNGSWNALKIDTIYHLAINGKYSVHLQSLRIIDLALKGFWMKTSLAVTARKILSVLIANELRNWLGIIDESIISPKNIVRLPEYVELSFHCFAHKIQSLVIDVASFMKQKRIVDDTEYYGYSWLRPFFIHSEFYFLNLEIIIPLFPNCKSMQILNSATFASSSLKFELNEKVFDAFLKIFAKYKKRGTELRQIQISGLESSPAKLQKLVASYQALFKKQKWHLQLMELDGQPPFVMMQCIRQQK